MCLWSTVNILGEGFPAKYRVLLEEFAGFVPGKVK